MKNIERENKLAKELLVQLKEFPHTKLPQGHVRDVIHQCCLLKYHIPDESETDFRKLAIVSIKMSQLSNQNLPEEVLMQKIHQYDCHQTSLISQKKTLFTMFIEKELGILLDDEAVVNTEDTHAFADLVWHTLRGGSHV